MKIKVQDGWQIKHEGKMRYAGDTFDANDHDAQTWINAGMAKAVTGSANKMVTSAETANKGGVTVRSAPRKAAKPVKKVTKS